MSKIAGQGLVAFAWRFLLLSSIYGPFYTAAQGGGSFDERRLQQISQSMNPKLKMCDDFYSYACENWQGPELIKILEEKIQGDTLEILEQLYRASEPKFLRELYQYYEAYKEVENPQPLEYLKWLRVYENMQWSLVENKTLSGEKPWKWNVDWLELLAKLRQFGFNDLFFQEDVIQSKEDPYKGVVELKIPDLSYLYDFEQQVYILGDLIDESLVESLAEFQAELSKVTLELVHSEESDDFNYRYLDMASSSRVEGKLVTLKDLYMPWLNKYLQLILQQTPLDPNMQIQVQSVKYLKRIYSFLSKYDNQMLCDYIQIKFLIFLMKDDRIHYKMDAVNNIRKNFPMILQWIHGRIHKELPRDVGVVQRLFSNLKENFKKVLQSKASTLPSSLMEYMMAKLNTLELVVLNKSSMELEFYYGSLSFLSTE
uniref:Peptidase M13 N-terminal domain-containing protein n=1 Tax=Musca domestica TaxID=7370 RepID=A0A1I8N003_MUSDO